jgi:hypothetical protein
VDKEDNKSYSEKLLHDEKILHEAMVNGYMLVAGKLTYEELIDIESDDGGGLWLPTGFDETTSIDNLIEYFADSERENYEICAELVEIKKKLTKKGQLDELTKIYNNTKWVNKKKL